MTLKPDFKRLILPHLHSNVAPLADHSSPQQRTDTQERVSVLIQQVLDERAIELDDDEFADVLESMMSEVAGLSVLEDLLHDERISDVTVIGPKHIFITLQGERYQVEREFDDEAHLLRTIDRLLVTSGASIDRLKPHMSLLRPDGSQVEVILPPLARQPTLHIYKNNHAAWTDNVMVCGGMITSAAMEFLKYALLARLNIAVIGAGGTRKTTLLNGLIRHIPMQARIVLIEDHIKLQPSQPQVIELTAPRRELAPVLMRQIQVLRPDYCIVAGTAGDLLAQLLWHDIPYLINFPTQDTAQVIADMLTVCRPAIEDTSESALLARLGESLNLVVALDWRSGMRNVTYIGEVNPDTTLTPIWAWSENRLRVTGHRPRCLGRLENAGLTVPASSRPSNSRLIEPPAVDGGAAAS